MGKLVVIFLCLAAIQASLALKCKHCKDSAEAACTMLEDETCQSSPADKDGVCMTFIYKTADTNEKRTLKGCSTRPKNGKFECIKTKLSDIEVLCEDCTTDFCNEKSAAGRVSVSLLGVVGILAAIVVPKFM